MKLLSYLLIITGAICFAMAVYYVWLRNDPNRLAFKNYDYSHTLTVKADNPPREIIVPDLHIDLPIIPAKITNNTWQTTQDGASYLVTSPIPGDPGNSIIYAHNWASLFGSLVYAKPGQKVDIDYADGSSKTFTIEYTQVVSSDESSILAQSKDNRITLYTCTGWFDTKRFVAVAVLDK
jgi:LPXTG-site transpeptidase (sortase) family protein